MEERGGKLKSRIYWKLLEYIGTNIYILLRIRIRHNFVRLHNWSMNVEKELDSRNTELSELVLPSILELVDIMPRCFVNFTEDTNT